MFEYNATLIHVVDGDTIDVQIDLGFNISVRERVRLNGVNAPEIHSRDADEKARGTAARDYLASLLPESFVLRTNHDKREKFGRLLAEVFVGDTHVNQRLIEAGQAKEYHGERRT